MRQITQCLNSSLASIYQEAAELNTLTALVCEQLQENIPCHVSRFSKGCLTLTVEDAVWAAQLRYELPTLRDQLRKAGLHHLISIRISLAPHNIHPLLRRYKKRSPQFSKQAKQVICESAEACSYPPLKAALERLGAHQASTKTPSG